ncbi:hypothetical protein FISHEDRAFT_57775 [Fistulina hepatica ATCC 64428]|uniref:Uncharacterized protein n=1 Tax=Fistulina hepatica ATCC 64428 TaxID=1128425 RepID=A0A0D7AF92_9AGAR|nr:hypothetical protein FISHEDRAFT_57775 [Fistulina hepatica ATCC 64428]
MDSGHHPSPSPDSAAHPQKRQRLDLSASGSFASDQTAMFSFPPSSGSAAQRYLVQWASGQIDRRGILGQKTESDACSTDARIIEEPKIIDEALFAQITALSHVPCISLTIACIAPASEIYSVIASGLFQRHSWGILEPLLGLAIDDNDSCVRLVVGWLSDVTSTRATVNVAHAARTDDPSARRGIYDLADLQCALQLAYLLHGIRHSFAAQHSLAQSQSSRVRVDVEEHRLLPWRLDLATPRSGLAISSEDAYSLGWRSDNTHSPRDWTRIDVWRHDISIDGQSNGLSHVPRPDISSDTRSAKDESVRSAPTLSGTPQTAGSGDQDKLSAAAPSQRLASSVGKLFAAGGKNPNIAQSKEWIHDWLASRQAVSRTAPTNSLDQVADEGLRKHMEYYLDVTPFAWFTEPTLSKLQDVGKIAVLDSTEANDIQTGVNLLNKINDEYPSLRQSQIVNLTTQEVRILAQAMPSIVEINKDVISTVEYGWSFKNEAEFRFHFDRLFVLLFRGGVLDQQGKEVESNPITKMSGSKEHPYLHAAFERVISLCTNEVGEALLALLEADGVFEGVTDKKVVPRKEGSAPAGDSGDTQETADDDAEPKEMLVLKSDNHDKLMHFLSDFDEITGGTYLYQFLLPRLDDLTATYKADWAQARQDTAYHRSTFKKQSNLPAWARQRILDPAATAEKAARLASEEYATCMKLRQIHSAVLSLAAQEPKTATCDSVGMVCIPNAFNNIDTSKMLNVVGTSAARHTKIESEPPSVEKDGPDYMRREGEHKQGRPLLQDNERAHDNKRAHASDLFAFAYDSTADLEAVVNSLSEKELTAYQATQLKSHIAAAKARMQEVKNQLIKSSQRQRRDRRHELSLVIVAIENKRWSTKFIPTAINQSRMYTTSVVKHYAALGIFEIPVFGIITENSCALVTMTYAEKRNEVEKYDSDHGEPTRFPSALKSPRSKVHIVEHNVMKFDITNFRDILGYATFLIRLRTRIVPKIYEKFNERYNESGSPLREVFKFTAKGAAEQKLDNWKASSKYTLERLYAVAGHIKRQRK